FVFSLVAHGPRGDLSWFGREKRCWWLIRDTPRGARDLEGVACQCAAAVVFSPSSGRRIGCVVSMRAVPWPDPDRVIAAAIEARCRGRRAPLAVAMRDRVGEWMADELFAAAFGARGRPGWPPSRLALVTVWQMAENLTDRQAAEAVRIRLDWQYALGLALDDP